MVLLAAFSILLLVGCSSSTPSQGDAKSGEGDKSWQDAKTVKIGVAISLTGPGAQMGIDSKRGVEIALKELGNKINGKPVEAIFYDEKGTPEQSMKAITRLIEQDKVAAIYGPQLSNSIMAVGPTAEAAKIPLMGAAVGVGWTQQGWKYIFRPVVNTYYMGQESLKLFKALKAKKVAIFNINDEFGNGYKKDIVNMLQKAGGYEIVATETHKMGDQDFTGQCAKIVQSGADVVFVAVLSNDAGPIAKQLRKAGFTKPIIGDTSFSAKAVRDVAGDAANGVYFVAPYILPDAAGDVKNFSNPIMRKFLETYFADYKEAPLSENTYRAYDGIKILAKAIEKAKSLDGPKLRDAIESINDYEGLGGKFNYQGANGDGIKTCNLFMIQNRKIVEYK
jgi:branched-chain amino acid transport system substrate-binding protein